MEIHPKQNKIEIRLKSISPMLTGDTDELQLINIEKSVVKIRMKGNREQGVNSEATLKKIIQIQLKQVFPEIESVELSD
jgi:Fe-S cluster biogenesis protein NfuA